MVNAKATTLNGVKGYFINEEDMRRLVTQWQDIENLFAKADERKARQMIVPVPKPGTGGTA